MNDILNWWTHGYCKYGTALQVLAFLHELTSWVFATSFKYSSNMIKGI